MSPPFHLAFPVHDLAGARRFYGKLLGCPEGRTDARWLDFDFFGHQITAHLVDPKDEDLAATNAVDGDAVPARHFGVILEWTAFEALRVRLEQADVRFRIAPRIRFQGAIGEQATMFLDDPSGNTLEFKAFRDPSRIFARS
jgi:hypothetical protein